MRTIRIKVYKFEELSKKAQTTAIMESSDINVNYNWWDDEYEDANIIGLKLTSFDLDRNKHAKGGFVYSSYNCATLILENHSELCETYKLAKQYVFEWDEAVKLHSNGIKTDIVMDGKEGYFDNYIEDREKLFLEQILDAYADILQKQSEFLQSDEAIKSTLIASEYEFTKDGHIFNS